MKEYPYITNEKLQLFIRQAFLEDVGDGDHSTLACVPYDSVQEAELKVKDDGIIAGIELAKIIFATFDPSLKIETYKRDGDRVKFGDIAFKVKGSSQSILTCERLVLNCMQRMSGIATYANEMMSLVSGTNTKILDTRKTTPNFRMFEKWAVKIGGAENHRFGLYDMVMLKDNHVDFSGSITKAVEQTKDYLANHHLHLKIEVETRNLDEVKEALDTNVDFIMLDNFSLDELREAVKLIDGKVKTEASGGITKESVRAIAETGVDFISSGAIIHSAKNFDLSLKAIK
ncbi:nicotinate-nucleotide pyrophosphorylase [carboxylating] [Chishuiella changwenlii]|uniref:Probable nicotinate-nucleotide pyrophosphorylase [carboxylating] n=1 Tax=Chishuiella changwenlii TaxID=1434701 RepID=A0A1M6T031_9FLAO|nr:carboxylating nicotinate-nucleotide diphosphorylase [Chishuiella changwenlii]GGE94399.1 nicotinate-nucleotide diphosphorylase (carboxylating) [Chishuiella changwenlii]SHK50323.1 nicotinate-nucleotide pyrophosphorylase [carboxylating] [Chishuiella changwenlii]